MGKFAVGSDLDPRHFEMNPMPSVLNGIIGSIGGQLFGLETLRDECRIGLVREVFNPSTDKLGLLAECSVVFEISWQFGYVVEDPAGDEASRDRSPSFPNEHRKHKGGKGKGSSSETVLIITSIFIQEVAGSAAAQES
ncbi:hypothetical protein C8J57DRAFT_1231822 [Mycena rebaudengoi]|nr:hypothetical protein C8J57DRAFT_1231822 [Mycena rebaudengoi]